LIELSYESDFSFTEEVKPLIIRGVALNAGIIPSKKLIIPEEELDNLAKTLKEGEDGHGAYLLLDHDKRVENVIGRVVDAWVEDGKRVEFEATCYDDVYADKIRNHLISFVSTGLTLEHEICSICGREYLTGGCNHRLGHEYDGKTAYIIGKGLRGREISLVLYPADPGASLAVALSRELEKIEKKKEEQILSEELNKNQNKEINKKKNEGEITMVEVVELTEEEVSQHPFVENLLAQYAELQEKVKTLEEEKKALNEKIEELSAKIKAYEEAEAKRRKELHDNLVAELLEKRKEAGLPEKKAEEYENFSDEAIKEMIEMVEATKKSSGAKGHVNFSSEGKTKDELKEELRKKLGWA